MSDTEQKPNTKPGESKPQLAQGTAPDSSSPVGVSALGIKLPPFWKGDPEVWFAQIGAQFLTRGITSEHTRYAHVIASLPSEVALEIRDILINPPTVNQYTELRAQLISHMSSSEQRRVQMLLNGEELADRKPSQLLRRMQQLLGSQQLESRILRELFLQRLPPSVRLILASSSDALAITDLAILADKILEASIAAPNIASPGPAIASVDDDLRRQVSELTRMVSDLTATVNRQQRSRSRSRSRKTNAKKGDTDATENCWYHEKYREKANKCRPPTKILRKTNSPAGQRGGPCWPTCS